MNSVVSQLRILIDWIGNPNAENDYKLGDGCFKIKFFFSYYTTSDLHLSID